MLRRQDGTICGDLQIVPSSCRHPFLRLSLVRKDAGMTRIDEPYRCDVCGKLRESDANHWWLVWVEERDEYVHEPRPHSTRLMFICVMAWAEWMAAREVKHACGQACAQQLVERWLTTGSLEEKPS